MVEDFPIYSSGTKPRTLHILGLADHLNFAIERFNQGIVIDYPLRWEVAQLFPTEFELGRKALIVIADRTGVKLPDDEATLLAMHFVNAQFAGHTGKTASALPTLLVDILIIVEKGIDRPLDRNSVEVARFITHLRYLFVRLEQGKFADIPIANLKVAIEKEAPVAFATAHEVLRPLTATYGDLSKGEVAYLALHIERLRRAGEERNVITGKS